MAKSSGLGANCYVGGFDLSGDVGSLQNISTPRAVQDVTGINKSAMERIYLTRDGAMAYSTFFNPSAAQSHPVLSALPTTDQPVTYVHRPTIGQPAASMVGKQINYDGTRNTDGSLGFTIQAQANGYGLEWGRMLTAGVAETTTAGALAGLDYGVGVGQTLFGLQAYLHVFAFTGTSATAAVQDSADGSTDWQNVTDGVFAAATAVSSQRIQTDRDETVRRHLRVNVTGTFTVFDYSVVVIKNTALVEF
jgi:hypothetical protein